MKKSISLLCIAACALLITNFSLADTAASNISPKPNLNPEMITSQKDVKAACKKKIHKLKKCTKANCPGGKCLDNKLPKICQPQFYAVFSCVIKTAGKAEQKQQAQ